MTAISRSDHSPRWRLGAAALLIAAVFLAVRWRLALTATLAETYYDEALTGLMALDILQGLPQVFYWGQPYLGAIDAYVAAAGFRLFGPSTLVLRLATVTVSVAWAWALWSIGRRTAGEGFGLLAGLYVALPPIFLSYVQLSSHGENLALTLGAITLAVSARLMDPAAPVRGRGLAWVLLGLIGGLGFWASQMMGMFLLAAAAAILVARPRVVREPGPYVAGAAFVLGGLPLWVWNARHGWATFWHLATWGQPPPSFAVRIQNVAGTLLMSLQDHFWDGRAVREPLPDIVLAWLVTAFVYTPAVLLAGQRLLVWVARLLRRERPWQEPLDLVVLAFWLTVAAHLLTWFGTSGVLRYSMTFYATLPVLCATVLARVAAWGRTGRVAALTLAGLLLAHHATTSALFVRQAEGTPYRPVDQAIARLDLLGVRACYADSRIAQVIAFESAGRIPCADYHGLRNFAFLQRVDVVEEPAAVAIVTHRVLQNPAPAAMAATLRLLGAAFREDAVGDYVIFHHFEPPDPRIRPIASTGWSARAGDDAGAAGRAFDGAVWTRWKTAKTDGAWLALDLGRPHALAQLTLESAPFVLDGPLGLRLETSLDGRTWETAAEAPELVSGAHWWKGHPRVDDSGRVVVRLAPRPVRHVRLTQLGTGPPGVLWSVAEVFAWEAADAPWTPPVPALEAHAEALEALERWMDDPGGPHPKRAPVTYEHRRAQVSWARVFAAVHRALDAAPAWEEAHHLYARTLALADWSEALDLAVARARADGAWREVLRWADLADRERPGLWRSGRDEARVEALARLGRSAEADAARAEAERREAARRPARSVRARFGDRLDLTGVDLPAAARPGERVTVRYAWRVAGPVRRDYWAFVHFERDGGPAPGLDQDHFLGADYGTSRWAPGERVVETLTLIVPAGTASGLHRVVVGVWRPEQKARLAVTDTDLPRARDAVVVGTLTILP